MNPDKHIGFYELTAKVRGDSWRGIGTIKIRTKATAEATPAPPSNPVASAILQFRAKADDEVAALTLTTANGGIVIVDANDWEFSVPPVLNCTLGAWKWLWDFQTTDTTGFVRTYLAGTLNITRDTSRA